MHVHILASIWSDHGVHKRKILQKVPFEISFCSLYLKWKVARDMELQQTTDSG